jgi:hypothetical protein
MQPSRKSYNYPLIPHLHIAQYTGRQRGQRSDNEARQLDIGDQYNSQKSISQRDMLILQKS